MTRLRIRCGVMRGESRKSQKIRQSRVGGTFVVVVVSVVIAVMEAVNGLGFERLYAFIIYYCWQGVLVHVRLLRQFNLN